MVAGRRGGILGLLDLIDRFEEAIEADLIDRQLRLRDVATPEFTWSDFRAIVRNLGPSSALSRARDPEGHAWADMTPLLLREAIFELQQANWQRGGGKGRRPQRIPLPSDPDVVRYGFDGLPTDEMNDWLGGAFAALNRQN